MQNLDCTFCRRTFYKLEHLKRHERSHTGSRPYSCDICHRHFGRQDSLHRHKRLHLREQPYASPSPSNGTQLSCPDNSIDSDFDTGYETQSLDTIINNSNDTIEAQSIPSTGPEPPVGTEQIDYSLIWPDAENLFQTIISSSGDQWPNWGAFAPATSPLIPQSAVTRFGDQPPSIDTIPINGNNQAVTGVSDMVHLQSSSVMAAAKAASISSVFLDECLHMFFVRFLPTFPILHRPTFVFRDCLQPLLLNAMAIGSLYLGHPNAISQGEVLWRLAHTALATTWQLMIAHRGPYDEKPGVQLLLTSLLGQVYGILSKNQTIRMTSQAFHVLSFVWAKQCGLTSRDSFALTQQLPANASEHDKNIFWKRWVASTIQHRALMAHYSLDGLISRMMGVPTSERHISNRLYIRSDEHIFTAQTLDEFVLALQIMPTGGSCPAFDSVFRQLLSGNDIINFAGPQLSPFAFMVLLEGLQSVLTDEDDEALIVGISNSDSAVGHALMRIYGYIDNATNLSGAEKQEALLRWHAICLESILRTSKLGHTICQSYNISQTLWVSGTSSSLPVNLAQWPQSEDGRRALLHAVAIQNIVEDLPRGRAHAIHMPSALFSAAIICAAFCLAGVTTVNLPSCVDWEAVVISTAVTTALNSQNNYSETRKFVKGEFDSSRVAFGAYRHLPYEFNSMQKLFGCLATQWGVAGQMSAMVREWATRIH